MKTYSASDIALHFVKRGIDEGRFVTQMKLQKMVYFAQGYYFAKYGQKLISDDVQAWQYGPVFPSIYEDFKLYGSNPIESLKYSRHGENPTVARLDEEAKDAIDFTWDITKDISASQLSNWTHIEGSPWERAYKEGQRGIVIPISEIGKYFKDLLFEPTPAEAVM